MWRGRWRWALPHRIGHLVAHASVHQLFATDRAVLGPRASDDTRVRLRAAPWRRASPENHCKLRCAQARSEHELIVRSAPKPESSTTRMCNPGYPGLSIIQTSFCVHSKRVGLAGHDPRHFLCCGPAGRMPAPHSRPPPCAPAAPFLCGGSRMDYTGGRTGDER